MSEAMLQIDDLTKKKSFKKSPAFNVFKALQRAEWDTLMFFYGITTGVALGLVQAAGLYGEPYLDLARRACDYWLRSRPDPLPANRLERPEEGEDPSAAVIAALAMLGLSSLLGGGGPWREQAECLAAALLRSRHFGSTGVTSGIFGGMCYRTQMGEELVESACSSFFLLKLLLVLDGRVDPLAC